MPIPQRPGSAKGVRFITIEDETGAANLVARPQVMEGFRRIVMQSRLVAIHRYVQRGVEIVHAVARSLENRSDALLGLAPGGLAPPLSRAGEANRPVQGSVRSPQPGCAPGHPREPG